MSTLHDKPLYNAGTEPIPAYAVCELKQPGTIRFQGRTYFTVGKPTAEGKTFFVNGRQTIGYSGLARTGAGARPVHSLGVSALFDPELSPEVNDELGPTPDAWHLGEGSGFLVLGDVQGGGPSAPGYQPSASTKRVRVAMSSGGGGASVAPTLGLLVKNLPKSPQAALGAEGPEAFVGLKVDEAVLPLIVDPIEPKWKLERDENDEIVRLRGMSAGWLSAIEAGQGGSSEPAPVLVRGYRWTPSSESSQSEKETFMVEAPVNPIALFLGRAIGAVPQSDFQVDGLVHLMGTLPKSPVSIDNSKMQFTLDAGATVLAARIEVVKSSGTQFAGVPLQASCPETEGTGGGF